ncbi:MAG: lycopene cyclase domain-containing protein [Ginsengibacter sp.]
MKWLYLLVDWFTIMVPLLFSFHPGIKFYKSWSAFFTANILVALIFIFWDSFFIHAEIWAFNPQYLLGIYIFNLPVEEVLFFICIPYACVFTYYCLNRFYNLSWNKKSEDVFCITLSIILIALAIFNNHRMYTSVTFLSTGLLCLFLKFLMKINWFGNAITVYAILLVPFLIVNGILTGSGIEQPIVIYNNLENLRIRIFTIPIEDVIYGLEMFLLNILFYQIFQSIFSRRKLNTIAA